MSLSAAVCVFVAPVWAQPASDTVLPVEAERAATSGGVQVAQATKVEDCLAAWLKTQKMLNGSSMRLGSNEKQDGSVIFFAADSYPVQAARGTSAWVAARTAAFTVAELRTLQQMGDNIGVYINSHRSASMFKAGEDQPPLDIAPARALSNAEKLTTLTGKALDTAITQFDPNWNGAGMTEEQKRGQAVTLQTTAITNIVAASRLVAAGAFTIKECEGEDRDGHYAVQTGLLWTPKLAMIAQSIYDPRFKVPLETPAAPLEDQFDLATAADPDWMAYTQGARVYTNEKGERVVVGFGVASGSAVSSVDRAQAQLRALAAIQRFVGEKVEAGGEDEDHYADRTLASAKVQTFDNSAYNNRIDARAKTMTLSGTYQVGEWRGKHPWGNTNMEVIAMAYTPSSAAAASQLGRETSAAAARMQPAHEAAPHGGGSTGPVAAPVHSGASGNASDF